MCKVIHLQPLKGWILLQAKGSWSALEAHPGAIPVTTCSLWREAHTEPGFLDRAVTHGGLILKQFFPKGLYIMERAYSGQGRNSREKCYGLTTTPVPHCSVLTLLLIGNKLKKSSLSWGFFAFKDSWWATFLSLSQPMTFPSSLCVLERRSSERAAGWQTDKVNLPHL